MDSYNCDIRFDNIYISTYFCQIDERRKQLVRGAQPRAKGALLRVLCGSMLQEGRGPRGGDPGVPHQLDILPGQTDAAATPQS